MNRRDFLTASAATLAGMHLPAKAINRQPTRLKTLILIELKGGNDGLNTLIPYSNPEYYKARPSIAIARDNVLQLDEKMGFHPALRPLMPLWSNNAVAMMMGVGYPNPNRSHFRSIDIWESASSSNEVLQTGWLNDVLPHYHADSSRILDGIILDQSPGPLTGQALKTVNLKQKLSYFKAKQTQQSHISPALQHVLDVQSLLDQSNHYLKKQLKPLKGNSYFDKNPFAKSMALAAQIVSSRLDIPVIKTSIGSFDTHGAQLGTQQRLLSQFANAIANFEQTMSKEGLWNDVILMTYSEFGRRVAENGSRGTDHGTAAPHFLMGGSVKGGLHGIQPSLTDLDHKDLKHHVDFRQIYSSLEQQWFEQRGSLSDNFKPLHLISSLAG